jgi:hypothetical protein
MVLFELWLLAVVVEVVGASLVLVLLIKATQEQPELLTVRLARAKAVVTALVVAVVAVVNLVALAAWLLMEIMAADLVKMAIV